MRGRGCLFGIWNLFEICYLSFGIYPVAARVQKAVQKYCLKTALLDTLGLRRLNPAEFLYRFFDPGVGLDF